MDLSTRRNITLMHFGENTSLMFDTVRGVGKIPSDKRTLFISNGTVDITASTNKMEIIKLENLPEMTDEFLDNYSIVMLDFEPTQEMEEIRAKTKIDIAFLYLVQTKTFKDDNMFIDIEELRQLPLFKKTMALNEIRKKFKKTNMLKKFKFFK